MAGLSLKVKKRQLVLLLIYSFVILALIIRVGYIQFVKGAEYQQKAYYYQNSGRIISPKRGTIYDRNGKELAISASVDTVWVNPMDIKNNDISSENIAIQLSSIIGMDKEMIYKIITANTGYNIIKRKIDRNTGDNVRNWVQENNIKGINIDEDSKRYYPDRNLASHVIGFTGEDNQGLSGIEAVMENYLKGVPGRILSEVDAVGRELPFKIEKRIEAENGLNVVLTLDETIQYFAEKTLDRAILENKLQKGAVAIVMDPRNGDILALASKPDFDLNNPRAAPPGIDSAIWTGTSVNDVEMLWETTWRNKALIDTYEPGSTFKAITSAAAIEEGIIKPDDIISDAPVQIGKWTINSYSSYRQQGTVSFRYGVYKSVNPVFVRIAQKLGIDKFYQYIQAFGFYNNTGIELPEGKSIFHKSPVEVDMAVASFGQRFQITPIQLISAYTAIANGGKLIKPRLIRELTDNEGNIIKKFEPEVIRTVISKETSGILRDLLEGVVREGTGKNAYVEGYRVAGKTGTSETTDTGIYTASFCAFAPADNPVICVMVALFDPRGPSYMGGMIAAPVAGSIVEDTLDYLGIERRYTEKEKENIKMHVFIPDLRNKTVVSATKELKDFGLQYKLELNGNTEKSSEQIVMEQTPKPGASVPEGSLVILYTYLPESEVTTEMPDILNMSIEEASRTLNKAGLNILVDGMGIAVFQQYEPGILVPRGSMIEVKFRHIEDIE